MRDQYAVNAAKTRYNEKAYDQIKIYSRKGNLDKHIEKEHKEA